MILYFVHFLIPTPIFPPMSGYLCF